MSPRTSAATARPTSSGWPHRPSGTSPSAIRLSYISLTPAVMSVAMMPGRTSYTGMPSGARRSGKQFGSHREPRLAHTVLAAMRRRHLGRHRRHEHDRARHASRAPAVARTAWRPPASESRGPADWCAAPLRSFPPWRRADRLARAARGRRCSRARAAFRSARRSRTAVRHGRSGFRCRRASTRPRRPARRARLRRPRPLRANEARTTRASTRPRASARAMPSPMPRVPPVTSATRLGITLWRGSRDFSRRSCSSSCRLRRM